MGDELYGRAIVRVEAETRRALQEIRQFSRQADGSLRTAERSVSRFDTSLLRLRRSAQGINVRVDIDGEAQATATAQALGVLATAADGASGELRTLRTRAAAAARALNDVGENAMHASMGLRVLITSSGIAHRHLNDLSDGARNVRTQMAGMRASVRTAGTALRTVGDPATAAGRAAQDAGDKAVDFSGSLRLLATAALPAAAALAPIAVGALAAGVAVAALGAAVIPQIGAMSDAAEAEKKYQDAVKEHGRFSQQASDAQVAYQRTIAEMPPATRRAAASVSVLKEEFGNWSDGLAKFTMVPVTKGLDLTRALLPKLTPLVQGTSREFSHFLDVLAGASQSAGFDRFTKAFATFAEDTLAKATSALVRFTTAANSGEIGGNLRAFMEYARENGPLLADTLKEVMGAIAGLAVGFSNVGVSALTVINALAKMVNAIPPEWVSVLIQAYAALKLLRLGIAGVTAVATAGAVTQLTAFGRAARFGGVGSAIQGVTQRMSTLQKVGGSLGVLGIAALGINELAKASRGAPPDVDRLASSLKTLSASGKWTGELKSTFGDMDGFVAKLGRLKSESKALEGAKPFLAFSGLGAFTDTAVSKLDDLVRGGESLGALKDEFKATDQTLAAMATNGYANQAAEQFRAMKAAWLGSGKSLKDFNATFPEYRAGAAGLKAEQELAARGMGLFGEQAVATGEKLKMQKASADGLRQSLQALNDVNRQGLGGMIGFEAALDAAAKAAAENAGALDMTGGKLNLNSEKARTAATSLQDLAQKTDDAAASARESGSSWETVNGIYDRGRAALIKNAQQMGLNETQAKALADQILKTPDKTARLKGDVEDLKTKVAEATRAVKNVPESKRVEMKGKLDDLQAKLAEAKKQIKTVPASKRSELKGTITDLEQKVAAAKRALASPKDRTVNVKGRSLVGDAVAAAKRGLASVKDKTATVRGRDQASGIFGNIRRMLDNLNGKTATTYVKTKYSAEYDSNAARPFRRDGGMAPGFAGGGMPGGMLKGPGTGTSDSIPMWWAGNGEYVVNAKSTAKYKALIEAINSDTLDSGRSMAGPQGGTGGATARASTAGMELGQGLIAGMRDQLAAVAAQARALADTAVTSIRQELQISSPSKKLQKIGKDTGAGFVKGLTGTKAQINSTAKSMASSITSAFKDTGSRTDDRLVALISKNNKKLQSLAGQRDSIAKKISDAKAFSSDTASKAQATGSLGSIVETDYYAPSFVEKRMKASLASIKAFTSNVGKLQKKGVNKALLRQVLDLGVEQGGGFAKSLAGADAATIKRYNKLQSDIGTQSKKLGNAGADMLYDSGRKAGAGFLTGLKAQQKSIEALMLNIAKGMQKAIRKALGIKSPSIVMALVGRLSMDGLRGGLLKEVPRVEQAMGRVSAALVSAAPGRMGAPAVAIPGVGSTRSGGKGAGTVVHHHHYYQFTNDGVIGSQLELDNWLTKSISRLQQQRRLPKAA